MRKRRGSIRVLLGVVALLALIASGCGSTGDGASGTTTPQSDATAEPVEVAAASGDTSDGDADLDAAAPAADTPEDNSTEPEAEPDEDSDADEGPADEYVSPLLTALGVDFDRLPELEAERAAEAERLTEACMLERGFNYTPVVSGVFPSDKARWELEANLTEEEFVRSHGYGIATLFSENYRGDGVILFMNQLLGPAPDVERSEGEQEAFEFALTGRSISAVEGTEADDQLLDGPASEPGSCRREAIDEVGFFAFNNAFDSFFELLGDEWIAMGERIESDPRVLDSNAEWQRCMATRGHGFSQPNDIRDQIAQDADEIGDSYLTHPSTLQLLGQAQEDNLSLMVQADRVAYLEEIGALDGFSRIPELQAEVDALAEFEVAVATDSWECGDIELLLQVQAEIEADFVEQHADQIALLALENG